MSTIIVVVKDPEQGNRVFYTDFDVEYDACVEVCKHLDYPGFDEAKLAYDEEECVGEYKGFKLEPMWFEGTQEVYL